jgi:hypothetical protein
MPAKKILNYGAKEPTYVPSKKENSFDLSNDPFLPYKAMGTFWGVLIILGIGLASILIYSHTPQPRPDQLPPNLMIEGTK